MRNKQFLIVFERIRSQNIYLKRSHFFFDFIGNHPFFLSSNLAVHQTGKNEGMMVVSTIIEQGVDSRICNEINTLSFKIVELVSTYGEENMFLLFMYMSYLSLLAE